MNARTRFYREVSIQSPGEGERASGYAILLDGKPIRTPAGAPLLLPNAALAEAVAEEWRVQEEKIRPETMLLTRLANAAIDRVAPNREAIVGQILAFARSDLVCYRAEAPEALLARQARAWDPLIEWARARYGASFKSAAGIAFVEQPKDALEALERAMAGQGDHALAGLHAAATLLGSAIIALALLEGQLGADEAFAAAELDEIYQSEKWGRDHDAQMRFRRNAEELSEIARFFRLLRE